MSSLHRTIILSHHTHKDYTRKKLLFPRNNNKNIKPHQASDQNSFRTHNEQLYHFLFLYTRYYFGKSKRGAFVELKDVRSVLQLWRCATRNSR